MGLPKIFKGAKAGDSVFSMHTGWGVITRVDNDDVPIRVGDNWYMLDGRVGEDDIMPVCWPEKHVPQYILDQYPKPKRKVQVTKECWGNIYPDNKVIVHPDEKKAIECAGYNAVAVAVKFIGTYEVEE